MSADNGAQYRLLRDARSAPAPLRVVVSVALNQVPLEEALRQIGERAGLGLSYRPGLPGLDRRVTLKDSSITAADALLRVLRDTNLELLVAAHGRTLMLVLAPRRDSGSQYGSLRGIVRDAQTGAPLGSATVTVAGSRLRALAGADGWFTIARVPAGRHSVEAGLIGYAPRSDSIEVKPGVVTQVELQLGATAIPLSDVVVSPGHFGIAHEATNKPQTLSRDQIETLPQLGDDLYRTVNRLPGMVSNEMSARFTVRGGDDESMLVQLDGLELYEPYHLKDFDGSLSIFDVGAIGGVDLTTGGFAAAYGNHLTGTFDLRTSTRIPPRPRTQLALSLSNVRVMSQGAIDDGAGLWLMSARRGYLDILLKLADRAGNVNPRYNDLLGKIVLQLSPRHRVSLHGLYASDRSSFVDDDRTGRLDSKYGSAYAWANWQAQLNERLRVETLASIGRLSWRRDAAEVPTAEDPSEFTVDDTRRLDFIGVRNDWQATVNDRLLVRWGVEARAVCADYDYASTRRVRFVENAELRSRYDTRTIAIRPESDDLGVYLQQRARPWTPLTIETGLRWDRQSHNREEQWSPRVNIALALDRRTTLRAAWGKYAQPHPLHRLQVQDGEATFSTAERADQLLAGIEHDFGKRVRARIEAYRRTERSLRPRYRNLSTYIEPVPEMEDDRARVDRASGTAEGIEFFVQRHTDRSSWSASYALARAEDDDGTGVIAPRPLEQRHTLYLDYSFAPKPGWRVSWSWQYHSGWPTTPATFRVDTLTNKQVFVTREFGPYNSRRLPVYHRTDIRVSRDIQTTRGRLAIFLDVFNVFDVGNAQGYTYNWNYNGQLRVDRSFDLMLPRLPSLGVTWEF